MIRDVPLSTSDNARPNLAIGEGGVWLYVWPDNPVFALLLHFDEATEGERARLTIPWSTLAGSGLVVDSRTVLVQRDRTARVCPGSTPQHTSRSSRSRSAPAWSRTSSWAVGGCGSAPATGR